jgi:hypothetical protein
MSTPRDEAERLVAAALAAASLAAKSTSGFATGSPECCVCPLCKAIAAAREPDPAFAERLASGVSDLANAVAGVLRAFGTPGSTTPGSTTPGSTTPGSTAPGGAPGERPPGATKPPEEPDRGSDDVWHSATRGTTDDE